MNQQGNQYLYIVKVQDLSITVNGRSILCNEEIRAENLTDYKNQGCQKETSTAVMD